MRSGCLVQQFSVVSVLCAATLLPLKNGAAATPYQADLSLHGLNEARARSTSTNTFDAIPTVKVSGILKNVGHIEARFITRRNKTWTSVVERDGQRIIDPVVPLLLRGRVAVGGGSVRSGRRVYATAASVIKNELKITFPGRATGSRNSRQRIYTIRVLLDGSIRVSARISSVPAHAFHRGACGAAVGAVHSRDVSPASVDEDGGYTITPILDEEPTPVGDANGDGATLTKVITISTDADPEWYAKYGDASNAVIASIINTAEAIYDRQLGIRFRIVRQHVYTQSSPYTSTEPGSLLRMFTGNAANRNNLSAGQGSFHEEVDLKHLFTGKDLDGSVIGIAYIGTVCAAPSLAYGITQSYVEAANAGIFAHELGHNFGGFHDITDRRGLMYPSISLPPSDHLSTTSLEEISEHLSQNSGCISRELMTPREEPPGGSTPYPTPPDLNPDSAPAQISLHRRVAGSRDHPLLRLSGRVTTEAGVPVGAVRLNLIVTGTIAARVVTDDQGRYEFLVRFSMPRGRQVYAYVETEDEEVSSRFLWIGATSSSRR